MSELDLSHSFDDDLLRETVHQRYFIHGVSYAIGQLQEDISEAYDSLTEEKNLENASGLLSMASVGLKNLQQFGFTKKELSIFRDFKYTLERSLKLQTIFAVCGANKGNVFYDTLAHRVGEINSTMRQFNPLSAEALHPPVIKRAVVTTAAAAALVMALMHAGNTSQVDKKSDEDLIPVGMGMLEGGDSVSDSLIALRLKYEKALEDGTFTYEEFFRDIEGIVEMIPSSAIQQADGVLTRDLDKLTPLFKKLSHKDFLRAIRRLVNSPKYEDDRRNFRASSSMLLTEETRTGNCEARVRTMLRYIEKMRPELMKDLRVVVSKPTKYVGHVELALEESGSIFVVDEGLNKPLSAKALEEKQVVMPEEFFVKTFLKQQKVAEEQAKKKIGNKGSHEARSHNPHGDTLEIGGSKDGGTEKNKAEGISKKSQDDRKSTDVKSERVLHTSPSYVTDSSTEFRQKQMIAEHKKRVNSYWAEKLKIKQTHTFDFARPEKKMGPEKGDKYMRIDKFDVGNKIGKKELFLDAFRFQDEKGKLTSEILAFARGEQFKEIFFNADPENVKFLKEHSLITGFKRQNFVTDVTVEFKPDALVEGEGGSQLMPPEINDVLGAIATYDLDRLDVRENIDKRAVDMIVSQKNLSTLSITPYLDAQMTIRGDDMERLAEHVGKHLQVLESLEVSGKVFEGLAQKLADNNAPPYIRIETDLWSGDISPNVIEQLKRLYETHGDTTTVLFDRGLSLPSLVALLSLPEEYFKKGFIVLDINVLTLEHGRGYDWEELLSKLGDLRARYEKLTKYAQHEEHISGAQAVVLQNTSSTDEELRVLGEYLPKTEDAVGLIMDNTTLEQKKAEVKRLFRIMPSNIKTVEIRDIVNLRELPGALTKLSREDDKE